MTVGLLSNISGKDKKNPMVVTDGLIDEDEGIHELVDVYH